VDKVFCRSKLNLMGNIYCKVDQKSNGKMEQRDIEKQAVLNDFYITGHHPIHEVPHIIFNDHLILLALY
jgi:hypothetical protein